MTMENMEGDYFVPGTELLENVPKIWKDIQAGFSTCPLKGRSGTVRFQPEGGQERSQQTEGREFLKNMCIRFILLPMFIFCYLVRRWLSGTKLAWLSYSRTAAS